MNKQCAYGNEIERNAHMQHSDYGEKRSTLKLIHPHNYIIWTYFSICDSGLELF